jgi:hypothetical protein
MESPNTVSGLMAKRAELAGKIEHAQKALRDLVTDLEAIDGALRVFDPEMRLPVIRAKRAPIAHATYHHDTQRIALKTLREAGEPVSSRDIAKAVMGSRGFDVGDRALRKMMVARVSACLRRLHAKGLIKNKLMAGRFMYWELA